MNELDIIARIAAALLVGGVIGWERGTSHKIAGFRTHTIVAVGSCVAMILGEWYAQKSMSGDATRLAAQVISGIGFLGAGTIIREEFSIKGLTTAASVWTTACLGLAAGAGFFELALLGVTIVFSVLTIFSRIEKKFRLGLGATASVKLVCEHVKETIDSINGIANDNGFILSKIKFDEKAKGLFEINFVISGKGPAPYSDFNRFVADVSALGSIKSCSIEET